ncbi:MAG: hypothetical protein E6K68_02845 [Nitrospirae bacterium]|nr:MAG: hypothetical protein E6K68_02845 [Nitrospirota bacterium]
MDLFGKVPLVEIPILITVDQKTWLETLVKKGKIAIPPGGTLPEGSVVSIFMRTLLWNSEEQRQSLAMVPMEIQKKVCEARGLVATQIQVSVDQKAWLDKAAASSKVPLPPGDSPISLFTRILLEDAMEQQKALERADPWADDEEE